MTPTSLSLIAALILLVFYFINRRIILTVSTIGVYLMSHLIFVGVGVLLLPWILPSARLWFSSFRLDFLRPQDLSLGIILVTGGPLLVLLGYQFSHLVTTGGKIVRRTPNLLVPPTDPHPRVPYRLLLLSLIALSFALIHAMLNAQVHLEALRAGVLSGRPDLVVQARREATDTYLYALVVYNCLPFFGVGLWLYARLRRSPPLYLYALFYNLCAALLLVLVFQKRPLLVYLAVLFFAHTWSQWRPLNPEMLSEFLKTLDSRYRNAAIRYGTILFAMLLLLYYAQTMIGRQGESFGETVLLLSQVAVTRIFGRLALPTVMYAHYFPGIDPHYGLQNIGLISQIAGSELYLDTPWVSRYFTQHDSGSLAISAMIDFYGAFGMTGWVIGCSCLGILLNQLDRFLIRLPKNTVNALLTLFMLVFAYYLTQASLFRALLGYGGGIFFGLWLLISQRIPTHLPLPPRPVDPLRHGDSV